ncbi:thermonuclease family protein [Halomonas tibetensis]|uniref:Thermonuclease family protein n=1 Tax=Halomonas tibetensis TaxID=2259590 RepID=A0ABV7B644_9GAMM
MKITQVISRVVASLAWREVSRGLSRLIRKARHNRMSLFWLMAMVALFLPWMWTGIGGFGWPGQSASGQRGEVCRVLNIYDGDTVTVNCSGQRERVRLYCIDAPEMDQEPWGRQSRDYLRRITPAQVSIVTHDRDRYGRVIGELFDGHRSLNLALVEAGEAVVYPQYCSERRYSHAERMARQAGQGVWAQPGLQQRPWEWRR